MLSISGNCHCEEPPRYARGKLRDEAISKLFMVKAIGIASGF